MKNYLVHIGTTPKATIPIGTTVFFHALINHCECFIILVMILKLLKQSE